VRRVRAHVAAAVEDALVAFHGSRGRAPSDEALWANFAWTFGYQALLDAIYQGESEMHEHETEIPDSEKPKVLQAILNQWWETRRGGIQLRRDGEEAGR